MSKTGYMCEIDFDCELGRAKGGTRVYPSIEDLKERHDCWEECGIVEVEVRMVRQISPANNPPTNEKD